MKSLLRDNFCSSPWFHIRISPEGNYRPCRWGDYSIGSSHHVSNTSLIDYLNSDIMSDIRRSLLSGESPPLCNDCHYESSHGKVSGRHRQLLKSAISESNFTKTFCSSPHWNHFAYSQEYQGRTITHPVDLQIDLGNTCNSACIMCSPRYSSRLVDEHKKLHQFNSLLFANPVRSPNWSDDPVLVDKFIKDLADINDIKYIHFLGGETLFIKSFYEICNRLIDNGTAKNIVMGTTTNCTFYDDRIEHIIKNFKQVHIGLSIESITDLNDYVRWPSKISNVLDNIHKFLSLRETTNLQISLRITPSILSIWHLDKLIEFMIENRVIAESCNILYDPPSLRMELLSDDLVKQIVDKLKKLVIKHDLIKPEQIINRRRKDIVNPVISAVLFEYIEFLENFTAPSDLVEQRKNLVKFLKSFESIHNNNILEYLPEYEEFLRSSGY